mgnify:CR=1 FL=1
MPRPPGYRVFPLAAGYAPGDQIALAMDVAASEFFADGAYRDVTWPDHRPVPGLTAAWRH